MKKIYLLLTLFLQSYFVFSQISQAQKDSAVKQLYFKSASFQYTIDFKAHEYLGNDYTNTFDEKMTDEQILAKLNKSHQDAEAYTALCYRFFDKKDMKTAGKYFEKAMEGLKNWADVQESNAKPVMMMLDLCSYTQSYQAFDNLIDEVLKRFPKHIPILGRVYLHTLAVQKDFDKAEQLINQALAVEPYHLASVANWLALQQFRYIFSLSNKPSQILQKININLVEKALKNNPKSLAYQHLYYYALTIRVYMSVMSKFFAKKTDDFQGVLKEVSKDEKKQIKEVIGFFKKNIAKAGKSKNTMQNNAAFANVLSGNYKDAIALFEENYKANSSKTILEAITLTHFLNKDWKSVEQNLAKMLEKEPNDMRVLLSYMSLYKKYDKNETKLKEILTRVEQTITSDPTRSLILATWYLKQKNLEKADFYCDLLSEKSEEELLCLAVQAILKDDKEKALKFVEKILALNEESKESKALKKNLEK